MNSGRALSATTRVLAAPAAGALGLGLLLLPAVLRMAGRKRTALDGIVTIDDAVAACRRTGLQGWDLVTFAQRLVYRKFACYSTRNLWDTPARAFEFGMGYCTHYNLALRQILDGLGFHTEAVFSLQVAVADRPEWKLGHTWLLVTIGGETRTVCAGRDENLPGEVKFVPVKPERRGSPFLFFLSNLGMVLFCGYLDWRALLTGRPAPDWMFMLR